MSAFGGKADILNSATFGNAALQQKGADLIGDAGALTDQPLPHLVERLQVELLGGLGRNELHVRMRRPRHTMPAHPVAHDQPVLLLSASQSCPGYTTITSGCNPDRRNNHDKAAAASGRQTLF